jgi:NitT/TauT family transport system substrate-binding protein
MGRVQHAFLGEPAVTAALTQQSRLPTGSSPAPYCSVNMQEEWKRYSGQEFYLPLACTLINGSSCLGHGVTARFRDAYGDAARHCCRYPRKAALLVTKHFPMLKQSMIEQVLREKTLTIEPASQARPTLEYFFNQLLGIDPRVIGGKIPGNDFYWSKP